VNAVFAHVGMDGASMIIWFGLFMAGALFIGLALRDETRIDKKEEDASVRQIRDVSNLPLNQVREALRPKPAASADRPRTTSPHPHRPRSPHGPRLVR
jgi:hypothetical protein